MSFLTNIFCGCFACHSTRRPSRPTLQDPIDPQAGFVSRDEDRNRDNSHNGSGIDFDDGYVPVVPLPRYTPRPVSIHEKTLQGHARDPSTSSTSGARDEKSRQDIKEPCSPTNEDTSSIISSTFSIPSSYGNTSTATRETPPPPYSSFPSPTPSRPMSIQGTGTGTTRMSLYTGGTESSPITPPPMIHIPQPQPVFRQPDFLNRGPANMPPGSDDSDRQRQWRSWESR